MIDKRLFQLVDKKPLFQLVALRLVHLLLSMSTWLCFAFGIAQLIEKQQLSQPVLLGASIILLLAGKTVLHYLMEKRVYDSSAQLRLNMREKVMAKAFRLGDTNGQLPASTLSQLAIDGIEQLEIYYARFLPQLFYCVFASLIIFCTLVFFAWQPAVILLIGIPLIPVTIMLVMKIAKKILHHYWGKYTNLGASFYENLQGFRVLKAFNFDGIKEAEMVQEAEGFRKITMRLLSMQLNSITIMDLISYGGAGLGIGFALKAFIQGQTSLMGMLLFILLSAEVFIPMRQLGSLFHVAMNGISACGRLFDYLEIPEVTYGTQHLTETLTTISSENLSYGYEEVDTALADIELTLKKGQFTAFVGKSGSGKSTLAKILVGRFLDYQGNLQWNQTDIHAFSRDTLRNKGVLVDSHAYLYPTTIKENLLLADATASDERLASVLTQAGLLDEIMAMQNQMQTLLEENASNLSGGQRQRLIVAQALLKNADFYVFDEITSGVDQKSEEQLLATVHALSKEKIVLFVSHRLYNTLDADQVYVLESSKIVAHGTPQQLLEKEGFFKEYFHSENELLRGQSR
ncbi:ABC transporter ATP-binding protein/permease [Isobaculum melis]|uniref:ABC-type transport system involved in cytochrome bd biosynthesis, ATPase and permease components n=1 Tax=Isobaculum melis TaxID=142588 RepID=A0A1H9TT59_9LACT|nr:ABC transporter ATP-binding protein/permease [Isobaculum melis]SES00222.1 ABC-type transport system involved in cytochrome bd biosynthesis, ATPase and permease components [Isobaculum melis]